MTFRTGAVVIFSVALFGCAASRPSRPMVSDGKPATTQTQATRWNMMVGKWYGKQPTKTGGTHEWIVTRTANGTYRIDFRGTDKNGAIRDSTESGEWGISGNIFFTTFKGRIIRGRFFGARFIGPNSRDAYVIERLTKKYSSTPMSRPRTDLP